MKLRYLATVVLLALTTVAAHAQAGVGLYFNPVAIRASNSVVDPSSYAFLGRNSTSQVFYGYNIGGFWDFYHAGKICVGMDMRYSDLHANNGLLRDFLVGVRFSGQPFKRPFKPYAMVSFGDGTTKAPHSTAHVSKLDYGIFGGVDYSLGKHVDFRAAEIGYGALTTVSSGTVGGGRNTFFPADKLITFSSGLVFRF